MISTDGLGANRWVVPPEAVSASGHGPQTRFSSGVEFEFDGSGSARAHEGVDHIKAAACAFSDSLSQVIRQNPYRAVLIASGIGVVAGILLKRPAGPRQS